MKLSLEWLSQYIELPYGSEELAEKLTMAGIEVENIDDSNTIPESVVVAEVLERKVHPEADKLSICVVDTGTEKLQVVCGAPNCDIGVKAPLATVGTVFDDPDSGKKFKIKRSKLRGVESYGMLCSCSELGITGDSDGIMTLPANTPVGASVAELCKGDIIYTLEITPNRPDCLSHWGVARDISALTGNALKFPRTALPECSSKEGFKDLIEVKDDILCTRYTGRVIKNVRVASSPQWLQKRLSAIGLRPINNIVDITNFVLHELGQPLHAFDFDLLSGKKVVVRRALQDEKLTTLDGVERKLDSSTLVIADADKPVALAGVMGGEQSGVTESSCNILLESAAFCKSNIRATSRKLGISSDSSYRFERGIDYNMVKTASDRATSMILEIAGGQLVTDCIDIASEYSAPPPFECRFETIKKLVGVDFTVDEIVTIFSRLGLDISDLCEDKCVVTPPSYRLDIYREADLAEEVARIYGLDKLPPRPLVAISGGTCYDDAYCKVETAIDELIGLGLYECMSYSLIDEEAALLDSGFVREDLVRLTNPISLELEVMRPTLFPQMLETVKRNISRKNMDLALFEAGTVFCASDKHPEERRECCIALTGRTHPERFSTELEELYDFYDIKGLLEEWLTHRKFKNIVFRNVKDSKFKKGVCAECIVHGKRVAVLGEVADKYRKGIRTQNPLFMALLDLSLLLDLNSGKLSCSPISQYPSVSRDVAFVADESLEHGDVVNFILKAKLKNLVNVELFDIFRDEKVLGKGKKSLAYGLTFRHSERTLTDKEVNKAYELIRKKLADGLPVELR